LVRCGASDCDQTLDGKRQTVIGLVWHIDKGSNRVKAAVVLERHDPVNDELTAMALQTFKGDARDHVGATLALDSGR
jgi:hypothetical protein